MYGPAGGESVSENDPKRRVEFYEISPSEFFYRNRDLAGFSNPARALYSATRELVENSLDACEQGMILPAIRVSIRALGVGVEAVDPQPYAIYAADNGIGVDPRQVPQAFGKIFYGSKFTLRQARGMFGMGGTMAILYGQITTNKPVKIATCNDAVTFHNFSLLIDIQENKPVVLEQSTFPSDGQRGTIVELTLLGSFSGAGARIHEYFKQTALVNPHADIEFIDPTGKKAVYRRDTNNTPQVPRETKPHPYGIDVETLIRLIRSVRTPSIRLGLPELERLIKKELGLSLRKLEGLSSWVRSGSHPSQEPLHREGASKGRRSTPDFAELLERIRRRWDQFPNQLKLIIALSAVCDLPIRDIAHLRGHQVNFQSGKLSLLNNTATTNSSIELAQVKPFYDYLVKAYGGDSLESFMCKNFHRVGLRTAKSFLKYAGFESSIGIRTINRDEVVRFVNCLHRFEDFLAPDASCLSPLGEDMLRSGIGKELDPEFIATVSRPPSAYSGYPFIVEVGIAYGGRVLSPGVTLFRFANRIPLLYDEASDVAWQVIDPNPSGGRPQIDWGRYKIPSGAPLAIVTHICSTKIPYKTVGKEYLADRPELERELRNAVRDVLRKLSVYLSRKGSMEMVKRKMNIYEKYLPLISRFCTEMIGARRPPRYRKLLGLAGDVEQPADMEDEVERLARQRTLDEYRLD